MRYIKKFKILILIFVSILTVGCGNKEKKNILGVGTSGGSNIGNIVTTDSGTGEQVTVKTDAVQGTVRWQSSSVSGINGRVPFAADIGITLVIIENVSNAPHILASTVTDMYGKFEFLSLSPGEYIIFPTTLIDAVREYYPNEFDLLSGIANFNTSSSFRIKLEKRQAIVVDFILYPKYSGKPLSSTKIGSYKVRLPYSVDQGLSMMSVHKESNGYGSDAWINLTLENPQELDGPLHGFTTPYFFKYKFISGEWKIQKIKEEIRVSKYLLYMPSGVSEWSDVLYVDN